MSHQYSQYTVEQTISRKMPEDTEPLAWKASCNTCDWVNRRSLKENAKRSMKRHEKDTEHVCDLDKTESPIDTGEE